MNILTNVEMIIPGISNMPTRGTGSIYVAVQHDQNATPKEIEDMTVAALERRIKILKERRRHEP